MVLVLTPSGSLQVLVLPRCWHTLVLVKTWSRLVWSWLRHYNDNLPNTEKPEVNSLLANAAFVVQAKGLLHSQCKQKQLSESWSWWRWWSMSFFALLVRLHSKTEMFPVTDELLTSHKQHQQTQSREPGHQLGPNQAYFAKLGLFLGNSVL